MHLLPILLIALIYFGIVFYFLQLLSRLVGAAERIADKFEPSSRPKLIDGPRG